MNFDLGKRVSQQSPDFPDAFYRVAVKGLYVHEQKILMIHDFVRGSGVWELPGGGLDFGESIAETLAREVREEMGLEVTKVADKPSYIWMNRNEHARGMEWFYVLVLAYQIDIKTLDAFTPTDECREIKFFSKTELEQAEELNQQMRPFAGIFNPTDFV